jgi:hypothetical protein
VSCALNPEYMITDSDIRKMAAIIAKRFQPEKIIYP